MNPDCLHATPPACIVVDSKDHTFKYGVGCYRVMMGAFHLECCDEVCPELSPYKVVAEFRLSPKQRDEKDDSN